MKSLVFCFVVLCAVLTFANNSAQTTPNTTSTPPVSSQPQQLPQTIPSQNTNDAKASIPVEKPPTEIAPVSTPAKMPADFDLIGINPYFKNKPRMGKLSVTLQSENNEVLGALTGDFGDCRNCLRGASVKGKIGVRLYGRDLKSLMASRKNSSSIKISNCANSVLLVNNTYTCEFSSNNVKMKLVLKVDPR